VPRYKSKTQMCAYSLKVNEISGVNSESGLNGVKWECGENERNGVNGLSVVNNNNGVSELNVLNGVSGVDRVNGVNRVSGVRGMNGVRSRALRFSLVINEYSRLDFRLIL
jgi:hypothetical protein